ncbi:MAG: hypothetical protein IRZ16_22615 [Myxococcaceae bacterium]|nr:hypothetical protein [Myxococcaceae bacterium]
MAIVFDYLAGRGYDGQLKGSFELAASPWPSLVLTPQMLAARLEDELANLEELEARVPKDPHHGMGARHRRTPEGPARGGSSNERDPLRAMVAALKAVP